MILNARIFRHILMWSLAALVLPMILFPQRFGTKLVEMSFASLLMELVFYGIILFLFDRRISLGRVALGSLICLTYRLVLGTLLGMLIVVMYAMDVSISIGLAIESYIPAIILQAVAAPFILRPVFHDIDLASRSRRRHVVLQDVPDSVSEPTITVDQESSLDESLQPLVSTGKGNSGPRSIASEQSHSGEVSAFERATNYIGENGAVKMAAVVDGEGLLLGNFVRGGVDAEDWAPMGLLFESSNDKLLSRTGFGPADRISLTTADERVIVAHEPTFHLMVVAQKQHDDVLNVRIEQGLEMMRKYVSERYSSKLLGNPEKEYARSTE
ncbi:MAG: hypothetical protein KOO62_09295 [candidate division Zixibacteria bacterium]|nr:hypothetical protein [candidate division Zixibacteria bacterium]